MTKQEIIDLTQPLIESNRQKEALEYLSIYVNGIDKYLEKDLILQKSSFNRNQHDRANGLISNADYGIALARLNYALTQIMENLPPNGNNVIINIFPSTPKDNDNKKDKEEDPSQSKKILFLSANPKSTSNLRLGEELRKIKDILAAATERDQFELVSETAVQILTITKAMQVQTPYIVHFSGHGTGEKGIMVENASGGMVLFPTNGLNRLFKMFQKTVKCVVLNACYSKEQAEVISKQGIYVVGMNKAVGDKAAIDFAAGFYQSLGEGSDIESAFNMAMITNSANLNDADTPELWLNGEKLDI